MISYYVNHYIYRLKRKFGVKYYFYRILKRAKSETSKVYIIINNFYCFCIAEI